MLLGESVALRRLEGRDHLLMYRWMNDPEVGGTVGERRPAVSQHHAEEFVRGLLRRPTFAAVARRLEDDRDIGLLAFQEVDGVNAVARLAMIVGEEGGMEEAVGMMVRRGFDLHNYHRVHALVPEEEGASMRVLEANGFVVEGRMREDHLHLGKRRDTLVMGLLAPEVGR